jgi:hypothetical protein
VTRKTISGVAAAALFALLAAPQADAATYTYKFYGGGTGYTGSFSGAGTVYSQTTGLPIDTAQAGSSTDLKSDADYVASTIVFGGGSRPTLTATAGSNLAWLDATPTFGGLGVATSSTSFGDDQINGSEILRLQFGSVVTLTGIATLFDRQHCCFGLNGSGVEYKHDVNQVQAGNVFQIAIGDGGTFQDVTFGAANTGALLALNLTGDVFRFRQKTGQPEFYISALTAVPIPGAAALFVTGLAGVGYLGRRRKAAAAA